MSGLSGFNWADENLIREMIKKIKHRGNDHNEFYIDENISLGCSFFSLFNEINNDNNPIINNDNIIVLFNDGTIYNYELLKNKMKKNNLNMKNLLIALFKQNGTNFFNDLNGIFSFCIYDKNNKDIYLIRDRLGNKPLYYYHENKKFVFASEIKSFFFLKEKAKEIDNNAILEYLLSMNISKESFFKKINPITPGSYIKYNLEKNTINQKKYFDIKNHISRDQYKHFQKHNLKKMIKELDEKLHKAVQRQLLSDKPLGAICSGGVDSSLIAAIASKYYNNLPIFNVRIDDENLDESKYARIMAQHLQLDLINIDLDKEKFKKLYGNCIFYNDAPYIHPCAVGIYLLCKKAKEKNIKVILSGEGADELFGGYQHYLFSYRRKIFHKNPILKIANHQLSKFLYLDKFTLFNLEDRNILLNNYDNLPWIIERNKMFLKSKNMLDFIKDDFEKTINAYIIKDIRYYLPTTIREADRMAMAAGVEIRTPFLDNDLIDFSFNLPLNYKLNFFQTKYLLKKLAEKYLPKELIYRKKMGFGIPVDKWLGLSENQIRQHMILKWKSIFLNENDEVQIH